MMRYLNEAEQPDKKNPSSYWGADVDQLADFIRKDKIKESRKMPSDAKYGSTLMRKPHEVPADASSGLKAAVDAAANPGWWQQIAGAFTGAGQWIAEQTGKLIKSIGDLPVKMSKYFDEQFGGNAAAVKYGVIAVVGAAGIYAAYKLYQKAKEKRDEVGGVPAEAVAEAMDATCMFLDRLSESAEEEESLLRVADKDGMPKKLTKAALDEYLTTSIKLAEKMLADPNFKGKKMLETNLDNVYKIRLIQEMPGM